MQLHPFGPTNKQVVPSELVLIRAEYFYYHSLIWTTNYLSWACSLLTTVFDSSRARTRSNKRGKDSKKTFESWFLKSRRWRRSEEVTSVGHVGCRCRIKSYDKEEEISTNSGWFRGVLVRNTWILTPRSQRSFTLIPWFLLSYCPTPSSRNISSIYQPLNVSKVLIIC
jgi:hypothetical protein